MKRLINIVAIGSFILLMLAACTILDSSGPDDPESKNQSLIDFLKNNLPAEICVFNPHAYYPVTSKGSSGLSVNITSGSLNYDMATTLSTDLYDYVQVPITANTPLSDVRLSFPEFLDGQAQSNGSSARTFLISQTSKDSTGVTRVNVVTIVPHPDYMSQDELDSLDFFYDGFYNAIFFYSDLDGELLKIETYVHGRSYKKGRIATSSAADSIIATIMPSPDTLADSGSEAVPVLCGDYYGGELDPVIVIADRPGPDIDDWENNDPDHPSNNNGDDPKEVEKEVDRDFGGGGGGSPTCSVILSVDGRGSVTGEGIYGPSDIAECIAKAEEYNGIPTSEFIAWEGDIISKSCTLSIKIEQYILRGKIFLTAKFHDLNPCSDEDRGDPLRSMEIQGSGKGAWNPDGGTFGQTVRRNRRGEYKAHYGMDFACPVGTPVHATHAGVVTAVRKDVIAGESWNDYQNRDGNEKDCGNKGEFNAGNAVEIRCAIKGKEYIINYYHLSEVKVKGGDNVEAGQIIGLSGATGSASSEYSGGPHLHYQVNIGDTPIDPSPFLYSKFQKNGNKWEQVNPCN